ncbi:hypothetical protein B9L20_16660 [Serratia marcescens]|nr:hypothetical protein B9L20_16660 [Serratia marcescens]
MAFLLKISTQITPESAQTALIREDKEPPKVMTKSVFTISLSKSVGEEMKPFIEEIIAQENRTLRIRARTGDSVKAVTTVIGYVFEFIQNKEVCWTVGAIVIAWIRSKHGKRISIKKDGYELDARNLTEQELFKLLSETESKISISENSE